MSSLDFAIGVLIFVAGLLVSIALHEVGHLVPAKRFGVKVPEYFIGFGPKLWSTRRGDTEYGIKLLPVGGYVRLAGMYPPAPREPRRDARGRLSLAEEARQDSRADLLPGEEHRAFSALSAPRKLVVMLGGPAMNLLIAAVLLTVVLVGIGTSVLTTRVSAVQECLPAAGATECAPGDPPSPAAQAGLAPGDAVLAWGGIPVQDWAQVSGAIAAGGTNPVAVRVERDGGERTLTVTPVLRERPVLDDAGQPVLRDGQPVTESVPYVGISPAVGLERQPLSAVPGVLLDVTGQTFAAIATIPAQLWGIVADAVGIGDGASHRSIVSVWGVGDLAGQITGTDSAAYTAKARTADMLALLASLNLALFAFNLVPLPPLDGGHIAGALVDGARRGWARLRGAARPGPVDMARVLPLAQTVMWGLIAMAVILIWADIAAPIM